MPQLEGMHILVVEDEALIAIDIEAQLRLLGCIVVGPEGRLDEALGLAGSMPLDGALLDVNIIGGVVFPVAEVLLARDVPIILSTGFGSEQLPPPSAGFLTCASRSTRASPAARPCGHSPDRTSQPGSAPERRHHDAAASGSSPRAGAGTSIVTRVPLASLNR